MCSCAHTCTHTRIVADLLAQLICVALHLDPQLLQLLLHHPAAFSSLGPECVQLYMKGTASPSLWWGVIRVEGGRRRTQALVHVQESLFSIQIPVCPYFPWHPVQLSFPTSGFSCRHNIWHRLFSRSLPIVEGLISMINPLFYIKPEWFHFSAQILTDSMGKIAVTSQDYFRDQMRWGTRNCFEKYNMCYGYVCLFKNSHIDKWLNKIPICNWLKYFLEFLGGPVIKNPLANAGDMGSIPGLGRFQMLQGN